MGVRLGLYDVFGSAAFAYFYAQAIKQRRKVHVHARYLIATSLLLLGPALGRVAPIPFFAAGWDLDAAFGAGLRITLVISLLIAAELWRLAPLQGRQPIKVVLGVLAAQWAAFEVAPYFSGWHEAYETLGHMPALPFGVAGLLVGAAVAWWAWNAGKKPTAPKAAGIAAV